MTNNINKSLSSILYISHGGGPLPLLGDESHEELVANLKHATTIMEKPSAIIVISAHWEEKKPTITNGKNPRLIYDYYGFPKESQSMNESFEQWLIHTCSDRHISEKEREHRLVDWENAPAARYCHPREEHLLPLHVCYGIISTAAKQVFRFEVWTKKPALIFGNS